MSQDAPPSGSTHSVPLLHHVDRVAVPPIYLCHAVQQISSVWWVCKGGKKTSNYAHLFTTDTLVAEFELDFVVMASRHLPEAVDV